jgi:hypothetical protein
MNESLRQAINVGIALIAVIAAAILIIAVWYNRFDTVLSDLVVKNFAAIIGLPFAFIGAFVVIALFRQGAGPVEFSGFGLTFKGASGEIVLWVLCFLAIAGSIHMLWKP